MHLSLILAASSATFCCILSRKFLASPLQANVKSKQKHAETCKEILLSQHQPESASIGCHQGAGAYLETSFLRSLVPPWRQPGTFLGELLPNAARTRPPLPPSKVSKICSFATPGVHSRSFLMWFWLSFLLPSRGTPQPHIL